MSFLHKTPENANEHSCGPNLKVHTKHIKLCVVVYAYRNTDNYYHYKSSLHKEGSQRVILHITIMSTDKPQNTHYVLP